MAVDDVRRSMMSPSAPPFNGNGTGPLSGGVEGAAITGTPGASATVGTDRNTMGVKLTAPPCGSDVGVLGPVQGLERFGVGTIVDAPSTQSRSTPDTAIKNLDPLAADKTPGYGGR
jgi:hypothetical protein